MHITFQMPRRTGADPGSPTRQDDAPRPRLRCSRNVPSITNLISAVPWRRRSSSDSRTNGATPLCFSSGRVATSMPRPLFTFSHRVRPPAGCRRMLGQNPNTVYEVNNYYNEKVQLRKSRVSKSVYRIAKVVQEVLKEVEAQEPRFISTIVETANRFEGLIVHSPHEYEAILYLNQMGVFNFVDDGSIQGCAVLKLSDGRKRSMSLWVEFITASGYLSARKIRNRFQSIVAQVIDKPPFREYCVLLTDNSDVRLRVDDKYTVQITCAFRCNGIWPRSASHWPLNTFPWPNAGVANQVKAEGFDLTSRETTVPQANANKQANTMEADAWAMSMSSAENILLGGLAVGGRRKTLSILKCLRDANLDFPGTPVTNYILKTLVLYECEKHCADYEWDDNAIGDRIIGVLLQLVSCLQCRRCAHYFLPQLDLLRAKPVHAIEHSAQLTWALARKLMLNPMALQTL